MRQPKPAPGTTVLSTGFCDEPCDSRGQAIRNDREKSDWLAKMSDRTNVATAPRPKKRYRTNVAMAPRWQNVKTRSVRVTSIKTSQLKRRKWTKLTNATDRGQLSRFISCSSRYSCKVWVLLGASKKPLCPSIYLRADCALARIYFGVTWNDKN